MDPMYVAAGTVPYVASLYTDLTTSGYGIIAVIYQSMYGLANVSSTDKCYLDWYISIFKDSIRKWLKQHLETICRIISNFTNYLHNISTNVKEGALSSFSIVKISRDR